MEVTKKKDTMIKMDPEVAATIDHRRASVESEKARWSQEPKTLCIPRSFVLLTYFRQANTSVFPFTYLFSSFLVHLLSISVSLVRVRARGQAACGGASCVRGCGARSTGPWLLFSACRPVALSLAAGSAVHDGLSSLLPSRSGLVARRLDSQARCCREAGGQGSVLPLREISGSRAAHRCAERRLRPSVRDGDLR